MEKYKRGKRTHSIDAVKTASDALNSAQKRERKVLSSTDAILSMKKNIVSARSRGMTWAEIAEIVRGAGLPVDVTTIKKVIGPTSKPAPVAAPVAAPVPVAGKVGDRIRAERAAASVVAPAVPGVASVSQVKMDGKGGFAITPMIDDI